MKIASSLMRLALLAGLAIFLGRTVLADPGLQEIEVEDRSLTITLPVSLEGWKIEPGEGDQIAKAATLFRISTLDVAPTGVKSGGDLEAYADERNRRLRLESKQFRIWEQGLERYGRIRYHAVKITRQERLAFLPLEVEYWTLDHYIEHQGTYLRITLKYPNFMWRYFRPDRAMIYGTIKLGG